LPDYLKNTGQPSGPTVERDLQTAAGEASEHSKPSGGTRPLGNSTVLDRLIQQAVLQSCKTAGTGRSRTQLRLSAGPLAHRAVAQAQEYVRQGHTWVVDLDLEKFLTG